MVQAVDALLNRTGSQTAANNEGASQNWHSGLHTQTNPLHVASLVIDSQLDSMKSPNAAVMCASTASAQKFTGTSSPQQFQQQQGNEASLLDLALTRKLTHKELAAGLGCSVGHINHLKRRGMPMHSIDEARKWKQEHVATANRTHSPNASGRHAGVNFLSPSSSQQDLHHSIQQDGCKSEEQQQTKQPERSFGAKRLVILNDGTQYEGECNALGKFHGRGKLTFACGDSYFGEFSDGLKNGSGTYMYANQSFYNGQWRNGLKHGSGVSVYKTSGGVENYTWSAGDIFDGEFADNKRHGPCEYTWFNGQKMRCVWENGSCPEWSKRNAEILQATCQSRDGSPGPESAREFCILDSQSVKSSSDSSSSPPPARRPAGIYRQSPAPPLKRPLPNQDSNQYTKYPRGMDKYGWYQIMCF
jgi:hypothetical protein